MNEAEVKQKMYDIKIYHALLRLRGNEDFKLLLSDFYGINRLTLCDELFNSDKDRLDKYLSSVNEFNLYLENIAIKGEKYQEEKGI